MTICQIILQLGWQLDCVSNVTGQQLLVNRAGQPQHFYAPADDIFCGSPQLCAADKDPAAQHTHTHTNSSSFSLREFRGNGAFRNFICINFAIAATQKYSAGSGESRKKKAPRLSLSAISLLNWLQRFETFEFFERGMPPPFKERGISGEIFEIENARRKSAREFFLSDAITAREQQKIAHTPCDNFQVEGCGERPVENNRHRLILPQSKMCSSD